MKAALIASSDAVALRPPPSSSTSASWALSALHRSRITRESARVIASGDACMKMFRPTEHPIAPASTATSIRHSSSLSSSREPPASTTGMPFVASTSLANDSGSPGQFVFTMSAPSSAHRRTFRRRYSNPYCCFSSSTVA